MPMQIQLDHILKSFKLNLVIILILGLSLTFIACNDSELSIIDAQAEISNIKIYNLPNYYKDKLLKFDLQNNYPNLLFAVKIQDENTQVEKIILENPSKALSWSFNPDEINILNNKYIGANNINLYSPKFEEGLYTFTLLSNDGKSVSDTIYINNNVNEENLFIFLKNDKIYFSSSDFQENFNNYSELKQSEIISNFELFLYDDKKQLIEKKYYNISNLDLTNYFININSFSKPSYIQIEYIKNELKNIIKMDLRPSNSFF